MDESAKSLLIGVAASILSAIVVLVLQYIGQRILDRLKFASMEGEYYEISLPANEETGGAIKLKRRRNAFESEARNRENHIVWNGLIVMDKTIPYLGRGVYQYLGKHDSG